jgi:hypothetical protein
MVRTQIQLTEAQVTALKRLAASRHLSMAELIRQGVNGLLRSNVMVDVEEKKKRALAVSGRFRSGKRDISRNHDQYIAEALGE